MERSVRWAGGGASGHEGVAKPPMVVNGVLDPSDADQLTDTLRGGQSVMCCGHWQISAASRLQHRIASELGIPIRRLGDVHLINTSSRMVSNVSTAGMWGAVAIVYLESSGTSRALVQNSDGTTITHMVSATPHSLVVIPEGGQLVHSVPHQVAWLHIRRQGSASRSVFDYYFVAWVRANFVAPYDTERQRKLFGSFTRYPRYWHGFMWSFIGMFLTVFACLPLAWRAIQIIDRLYFSELCPNSEQPVSPLVMPERKLPTLLSHGGGGGPGFLRHNDFVKPGWSVGGRHLAAREPIV